MKIEETAADFGIFIAYYYHSISVVTSYSVFQCLCTLIFLFQCLRAGKHPTSIRLRTIRDNKCTLLLKASSLKPLPLRKHAYSNILKTLQPKKGNFPIKNSDIFHISAQNIDCGYSLEPPRQGGSNEYPQSMFLSRNKKNNIYPCKPQFYYIKVGLKGVKII